MDLTRTENTVEPDYDYDCLVDAEQDDSTIFSRVLSKYNAAKVENLVDAPLLERVLMAVTDIYKNREAMIKADLVPHEKRLSYRRRTIPFSELQIEGVSTTSFPLPKLVVDGAREYLGKDPVQAVSSVRAIVPGPNDQRLPFHQDQTILQSPLLNIWIPLTPCGATAPGLEIVLTNERKILNVIGSPDDEVPVERARIDEQLVWATFGAHASWRPLMRVGEGLVFTGTTAHRTYVTEQMTDTRISLELRLI
jgi:hypothetical protein